MNAIICNCARWGLGLLVCAALAAQCADEPNLPAEFTYTLEARSAVGSTNKCGYFAEDLFGTNCCPPLRHCYRQQDVWVDYNCSWGGLDEYNNYVASAAGQASFHSVYRMPPETCAQICVASTGAYEIDGLLPESESFHGTNDCTGWTIKYLDGSDYYYDGYVLDWTEIDSCGGFGHTPSSRWDFAGFLAYGPPYYGVPWWWYDSSSSSVTCASAAVTNRLTLPSPIGWGYSYGCATNSEILLLSDEFTTAELVDALAVQITEEWRPCGGESPRANTSFAGDESAASGTSTEARFKVFAPADERFEITYVQFQQYISNGVSILLTNEVRISTNGTGGWQYIPAQLLPTYWTYTSNGCVYYQGATSWIEVGCSSGSSCGSGQCDQTPGSVSATLTDAGPWVRLGLGSSAYGLGHGSVALAVSSPSAALFTPACLEPLGDLGGGRVCRAGTVLRQVQAPLCLADIVTNNATSYCVNFYTDYGYWNGQLFEVSGYTPFSTVTLEQGATTNQLQVTVSGGGNAHYTYDWSPSARAWTLTSGGGLRQETRSWNAANLARTNTIRDGAGQIVSQEARLYRNLTNYGLVRITSVAGPGGPALTTQWYQYDNSATDGPNYGKIRLTIEPTGFWRSCRYDALGRVTNVVSQFLNAATNAPENQCRVVQYDYTSLDGTNPCVTRVEKLLGIEVARDYTVSPPGELRQIRCQSPGASWTNAANLVTTTSYYRDGDFAGKVHRIVEPDATLQHFDYYTSGGYYVTTVVQGEPDAYLEDVVDGRWTQTTIAQNGVPVQRIVNDIALNLCVENEVYTCDALGRVTSTTYLDNSTTSASYSCCGLESTTDRQGMTTFHLYDALNRQVGTLRGGIQATNLLDAADNVLLSARVGTTGGVLVRRRAAYDAAGQLTSETNALNGVTTYAQAKDGSGQTIKTNIFPDGAQRVELYAQDGSLLKVTGSAAFPVRYEYGVEDDGAGATNAFVKELRLTTAYADTSEWTKTYTDMLGRGYRTAYAAASAPYPARRTFFNAAGRPSKEVDPDGVTTLYSYNAKGEREYTALDVNTNGVIDFGGSDRITRTAVSFGYETDGLARRTVTETWTAPGIDQATAVSVLIETLASSTPTTISTVNGQTTRTETFYSPATAERTVRSTLPDLSYTEALNRDGTNVSLMRYNSWGQQIGGTTFGYDSQGRQNTSTDARNGTTTYFFSDADQVSGIVTPAPAPGQAAQSMTNFFTTMGRLWKTTLPDNTSVTNEFYATGLLKKKSGAREYPVEYTYDYAGRTNTMKTWQNFAGNTGAATTTWNYDAYRGFLSSKRYADATGPDYTYYASGRLKERTWARGNPRLKTTYSYNAAGDLAGIDYADSTPDVSYSYDRRGRQTAATQGGATATRTFNDAGNLLSESWSGGALSGLSVTNGYDAFLRRTNVVARNAPSTTLSWSEYAFDPASRLSTVSQPASIYAHPVTAAYSYLANSGLVGDIAYATDGVAVATTFKNYDFLNRLTNIATLDAQAAVLSSFAYQYNSANQRSRRTEADSAYWSFGYDNLGQVTSGKKHWPDASLMAGQQFEYAFDDIGNRKSTGSGGDPNGLTLRTALYTANNLNQYTTRTVPGYREVLGSANSNAVVTVWGSDGGSAPTYRHGDYFRAEYRVNNATGAVWLTLTNLAVLNTATNDIVTNVVGNAFIPGTLEAFGYDLDGSLTNDGRWAYTWDAENRLTGMQSLASAPTGSGRKLTFEYDAQGRRVRLGVAQWVNNAWSVTASNLFVYDGWNVVAELNATNKTVIRSYVWGLDLRGRLQGAGGVGGLLAVYDTSTINHQPSTHFVAYDGNGNVMGLVNAADGKLSAQYEYGPFGEVVRKTGAMAAAMPFRFSTKYQDDETDLLYYGYRYYSASTGRWLSKDPTGERGGENLYAFVANDPVRKCDLLGKVQVIFAGGGVIPLKVDVVPTLTVSDVCHGGPLHFNVSFNATYNDEGNRWMDMAGAWFGYGGGRTPISNFQDYPMRWDVAFTKQLPVCPTGRQSGSMEFAAGESEDGQIISIIFDWHYRCDCACKEVEPFKPSYTYFFFPPIKPPPPPKYPGRPILL